MASRQTTLDYLVEQMASAGVSARAMFGEYALYGEGKLFALICDDQLFVKPTPAGRAYAGSLGEGVPYPGAKPCLLVTGDRWDDAGWLAELARITIAALPAPAPRTPKARPSGGPRL